MYTYRNLAPCSSTIECKEEYFYYTALFKKPIIIIIGLTEIMCSLTLKPLTLSN